jgi:hypothetical protein
MAYAMTFEEFCATLRQKYVPENLDTPLRALWLDANDDWSAAHCLVDNPRTKAETRVHAYLHRKEGDLSNARYWYGRASVRPVTGPLEDEWESLVRELLESTSVRPTPD